MKKLFVIFVCIFFLFSLITFAQNETNVTAPSGNTTAPSAGNTGNATQAAPPAASAARSPAAPRTASQKATTCGNKAVDTGENCFTCPQDVKCQSGQMCNVDTGKCDSKANFTTYIIVGIGIFVFLGLFLFAKRIMKKREALFQQMTQQQPAAVQVQKPIVQQPPLGQQKTPEPLAQQPSPVANAQIQMPPSTPSAEPSAEQKQTDKEQGFEEMSQVVNEHPGETMPQKFIRQMREKGWNDERIRMKMKESGWNETQIALEFLKSPKFIKKQ